MYRRRVGPDDLDSNFETLLIKSASGLFGVYSPVFCMSLIIFRIWMRRCVDGTSMAMAARDRLSANAKVSGQEPMLRDER